MIRAWPKPAARAASTYGSSRIASALERTTRAQRGSIGIAIASMTLTAPVPRITTTASARMMSGKARSTSITRSSSRSVRPPKYALATPSTRPSVPPMNDAPRPTKSAVREP